MLKLGYSMIRRFWRILCKRVINVVVYNFTDGDNKGKSIEGDATLDHLAKTVADSRGGFIEFIIPTIQPTV